MKRNLSAFLCVLLLCGGVFAVEIAKETTPFVISLYNPVQYPSDECNLAGVRLDFLYGHVHDDTGLTLGLVNIADGDTKGVDLGIVSITKGSTKGVQWGIVNWNEKQYKGAQKSWGFSYNGEDMTGWQAGLCAALTMGRMTGLQCGIYTQNKELTGVQFGYVNNSGTATGFQLAYVNVATEATGLQLGLVNCTKKMKGVQIGLINVIQEGPLVFFPIANMCF